MARSVFLTWLVVGGFGLAHGETPLKVAVVTGGHPYEQAPFERLFAGHPGLECVQIPLNDESELFEDISDWSYDVIVLYHTTQRISEQRRANFLKLLDRGVGVVALHHAVCAFMEWPEYPKIVGAQYLQQPVEENGRSWPKSSVKFDVAFAVKVADAGHEVTRGLTDFQLTDETYKDCRFEPGNQVLLTTDEPSSDRALCWVRTYRNARVCGIQPGHGPGTHENPQYRRLIAQAIRWVAGK